MEPTNRELKIILDNHQKRSDEKHSDLMDKFKEMSDTLKTMAIQSTKITKLEDWSSDTQKIVESLVTTSDDYKTNKTRVYTIISIMLLVGGTILTLAITNLKNFIITEIKSQFSDIR